ncbi:MAG: LemA family protein [Clostridia bacterium]|nr:LemA family protein [Clostridia bacterium]
MPFLYIFIGLLLIIVIWVIATINIFNKMNVKIKEADSGIDVALEKRYDLLTKALAVAKGYAKHEKETLFKVIELRKDMSIEEKVSVTKNLDELKNNINVLAEAYPVLKSSEVFVSLQKSIQDAEEHLQAARRLYNSNISGFNQKLVSFPSSVIGKWMNLSQQQFFMAEEEKRSDVNMTF